MHYLRADTSIDCDSTEHAEFLGYMVPLIVLYQVDYRTPTPPPKVTRKPDPYPKLRPLPQSNTTNSY